MKMKRLLALALIGLFAFGGTAHASVPNGSVTTRKLAYHAVTTVKIANNAICAAKIVSNAIRTAKIANGAVTLGNATDGSIAGKLNARYQVVSDTGTANTEFVVAHQLGRIPVGFLVVNSDIATQVYAGDTAWTSTNIYLKSSAANANITLMIW